MHHLQSCIPLDLIGISSQFPNAMTSPTSSTLKHFQSLVEIVAKLRGPGGCPWDLEQTQKSLTQYAIEEAHELAEAIETGNQPHIREELGDFLFQVILQAQVAQDQGQFDLSDVIQSLNEKMRRRHPHVFAGQDFQNIEEVWKNWEKVKAEEKAIQKAPKSIFNAPKNLPALQTAAKIGRKTQSWKFDWHHPQEVFAKVEEETNEVREALVDFLNTAPGEITPQTANREHLEHEIGDLLFSVAQLARHLSLDPESCLRLANLRFQKRFEHLVQKSGLDQNDFAALSDQKKNKLWEQTKKDLK